MRILPARCRLVVVFLMCSLATATLGHAGGAERGQLIGVERVGGYPALVAKLLVWWAGLSDRLPVDYGVTLYRATYWTLGEQDALVQASGLIGVPRSGSLRGVVSYQHGTIVERKRGPSAPTREEGVVAAIAFAGRGYLLLAPDYVGLGQSNERHPYYVGEILAANIVDLMLAARQFASQEGVAWPSPVFLTGFSEGGYTTIAALRALERLDDPALRVAGAAPIAGPYDLSGYSFPRALLGEAPGSSLYLGYLVSTYARAYGRPMSTLLRPPWDTRVPTLFDGTHAGDEVVSALPRQPRELFTDEVLEAFDAGKPTWLFERLAANDLTGFTPKTPVRLYYGQLDVDVSPEESRRQAARWKERGADARAVDVGPFDHDGSVLVAAPQVRDWFDELSAPR